MKLSKEERLKLRSMFGGCCAYCGCELPERGWHADHVEPIRRETVYVPGHLTAHGYSKTKATGKCFSPHNQRKDNLFPACIKCNILKADTNVEGFRQMLIYFANSIPRIAGYSHVHHLMRFDKLHIDSTPVVFWFEKFREVGR